MKELARMVGEQIRCGLKETVDSRIREFHDLGRSGGSDIFKELCFCILTANYSAEGGIRIQRSIGDGFLTLPEKDLAQRLKELGHRFPEARASYIAQARRHKDTIKQTIGSFDDSKELREWLVKNVKGISYKEASHFLRNIGFDDVAIIDFHIIDILQRAKMIERPKTLTRNRYLEIEGILSSLGKELGMTLAELDLYLWCAETGKVLK
ncbi:MAG: N-glycosylase/DNA lyase [Candidatus Aenigmarchaeota archaeon]|nr:N-glycosylase/DNA lyase [Candidatus Aenigmarchaeota archaeon]